VDVDVAVEARPEDVLSGEPLRVGVGDRLLEHGLRVQELTPYIDVGDFGADRVTADEAAFDEQMRIALDEQVILERPRLALVSVAGDVPRLALFVDELPLHARRESGAAAAAQTGRLDHLDDLVGLLPERDLQRVVTLVREIEVEREGIGLFHVLDQHWIHVPYALCPLPFSTTW
jgi:hypothetical protein